MTTTTNNQPGEIACNNEKCEGGYIYSQDYERCAPCAECNVVRASQPSAESDAQPMGADELAVWDAAVKALQGRALGHRRNKSTYLYDECMQCAAMLNDMKPALATPAASGQAGAELATETAETRMDAGFHGGVEQAGATVAEQIADVILHLIGNCVMDWKAGPTGDPEEDAFHSDDEERRTLIDLVNKALAAAPASPATQQAADTDARDAAGDLIAECLAALERNYPLPITPHTSVALDAMAKREAFRCGWIERGIANRAAMSASVSEADGSGEMGGGADDGGKA
jgi:hypothetical protein